MINLFTAPVEGAQQAAEAVAQTTPEVAAQAAPAADAAAAATEAVNTGALMGGNWSFWVMIIAMIAIMYFFMWRPEKKRRQKEQEMRDSLKAGDKIMTLGGIHGVIKKVDEDSFLIEVDSNVTLRLAKQAVTPMPQAQK